MEFWYLRNDKGDDKLSSRCLASGLYSTTLHDIDHFTKPKIYRDFENSSPLEAIDTLSQLDPNKKYILNPIETNKDTDFETIKQLVRSRDKLPNIEISIIGYLASQAQQVAHKNFSPEVQIDTIIASIAYGVDYACLFSSDISYAIGKLRYINNFIIKGKYKTKIIINESLHRALMAMDNDRIDYDGVCFLDSHIISELGD